MNIAILGPSGAGKGTHADGLSARYQLRQFSTGDLFRENLQTHTALGILARKHLERGELVPDELVDAMAEEWCYRLPPVQGALFDGFPRTGEQRLFLEQMLRQIGRRLDAVIYVHVPDDEIVHRLAGRLICRSCQKPYHTTTNPPRLGGICDRCGGALYHRPDDTPEMIQVRLQVFHRALAPVLDHYTNAGQLIILSGLGSIAEVDARLVRAMEAIHAGTAQFATEAETAQLPRPPAPRAVPLHLARRTVDLVLVGAPGSGKGTQAERLAEVLRIPHIATGDLFRENLRQETELGKLAKNYMDRGELVPDSLTDAMVAERLGRDDAVDGFILDGFPRTRHQAEALAEIMSRLQRRLAGVLFIRVADEEIIRRLSGRLICRSCQRPYHLEFHPPRQAGRCDTCGGELYQRSDDQAQTVRTRLATFHAQTEPLIAFYRDASLLEDVAGEGALETVFERTRAAAQRRIPKEPGRVRLATTDAG